VLRQGQERLRFIACAACLLFLLAAGCNDYPESYPPPEQRVPLTPLETGEEMAFVEAGEAGAEFYFVNDIRALEVDQWRWTGEAPTLRYLLYDVDDLTFLMEFALPEVSFKNTNRITVTFLVNGKEVGRKQYDTPGRRQFEAPVDPDWLVSGEETAVTARVNPALVLPDSGLKYGLIFFKAGFERR